jgi:pimeloyl-ACP methyl ester carboxylesterase
MAEERWVRSFDDTELFVRVSGTGTGVPIVLCDGLGCDGFIWRKLKPTLEQTHTVVRWHYRGHGQSKRPKELTALGIDALRRDLLADLDDLAADRAILFGHSMGVQVILDAAIECPERVVGLVPVCGSYGRPLDTFHDNGILNIAFPWLRDLVRRHPRLAQRLWTATMTSELSYQFAMRAEVDGRLLTRATFKPYFDHLAAMDVRVFTSMLDQVREHTVEHRLHEVNVPALIVAGERDTFTPVWLSRRMARLIRGAELLAVPCGTHVAPLEQPELVELRVQKFLRERLADAIRPTRRRKASGKSAAGSGSRAAARRPAPRSAEG